MAVAFGGADLVAVSAMRFTSLAWRAGGIVRRRHPPIILDTAILAGKPMVRRSRLAVEHLIGLLAEILVDRPRLAYITRDTNCG